MPPQELAPFEYFVWPRPLVGDVGWGAFEKYVDIHDFDWNLAIWWNADLAEAVRGWDVSKKIGKQWDYFEDIRPGFQAADGMETYMASVVRLPRTEARCAQMLAAAVRHIVKADSDARPAAWMIYDSTTGVWRREGENDVAAAVVDAILRFGAALGRAIDCARELIDMVEPDPGPDPGPLVTPAQHSAWELAVERRKLMNGALKEAREMARTIPRGKYAALRSELKSRVTQSATAWDGDTRWLVLRDGVVNVEDIYAGTGVVLGGHSPAHMSTMALDVAWTDEVRNAGKSEWEAGIEKVLPDVEVRQYLQKRFGAALLGRPGVAGKSMVWQFGPGDTAKSTLQECVAGDHGVFAPYSIVTSSDSLTERGAAHGASDRFKAYARGKRFVIMSELTEGEVLNQSILKSVTGGETVEGTAKYANSVSYFFTATLFMASNHPPSFPPGDTALVGRIHVVPFEHRLWVRSKNPKEWDEAAPEHRADEDWAKRTLSSSQERRAIFKWVIEGLEQFGREGIGQLPQAMVEAREDFAADADPVGLLVRTLLGTEPSSSLPAWITIMSDAEWTASLRYEGDGLLKTRAEQLINARARELNLVKFMEDGLSPKWMRASLRMLHELGGKKKNAMIDRESRKTGTVFSRIAELDVIPVDLTAYNSSDL